MILNMYLRNHHRLKVGDSATLPVCSVLIRKVCTPNYINHYYICNGIIYRKSYGRNFKFSDIARMHE